jgi:hypothetical protein
MLPATQRSKKLKYLCNKKKAKESLKHKKNKILSKQTTIN